MTSDYSRYQSSDVQKEKIKPENNDELYYIIYSLDASGILETREVFNIFDVLGDLGGVYGIFFQILFIFVAPISKFNFTVTALKKMFLVKTYDLYFFESVSEKEKAKRR